VHSLSGLFVAVVFKQAGQGVSGLCFSRSPASRNSPLYY
jgi:hypothetical protein